MTDDPIPGDLREFIMRHIDSVAELEALLLMRATPNESWDVPSVARRLYTNETQIAAPFGRFCEEGLLTCTDHLYKYAPSPELAVLVDKLADAHARHLIAVTNLIHTKPRRIREFADAFKLRKDR
jgi:hypothetical protein